jgi:hypothetical protein
MLAQASEQLPQSAGRRELVGVPGLLHILRPSYPGRRHWPAGGGPWSEGRACGSRWDGAFRAGQVGQVSKSETMSVTRQRGLSPKYWRLLPALGVRFSWGVPKFRPWERGLPWGHVRAGAFKARALA